MIQLTDIKKAYRTEYDTLQVLKGINLEIEKGEMVSIMGASGSGKSTLMNRLAGKKIAVIVVPICLIIRI